MRSRNIKFYWFVSKLGTSLNPNRVRSIGVFLFFVPKMCPKCDSIGATLFSLPLKKEVPEVMFIRNYKKHIDN